MTIAYIATLNAVLANGITHAREHAHMQMHASSTNYS